jgi:hypothetical protein
MGSEISPTRRVIALGCFDLGLITRTDKVINRHPRAFLTPHTKFHGKNANQIVVRLNELALIGGNGFEVAAAQGAIDKRRIVFHSLVFLIKLLDIKLLYCLTRVKTRA